MAGVDHARAMVHLFPGDGKEAAAVLVCTRMRGGRLKLLVREVVLVPHDLCNREEDRLTWPITVLDPWLERSTQGGLSLLLIHSHPSGYPDFSSLDDVSDGELMPYLYPYGHSDSACGLWHGTAIMMPGGAVKARLYDNMMQPHPVDLVAVYGDDLRLFWHEDPDAPTPLAFSAAMRKELARLSIAIIGMSGTGSVVAEQLLRMGVGELIGIDDDHVEEKNLNRILNSTEVDAAASRLKVDVFKDAAGLINPLANVRVHPVRIGTPEAIKAVADADIIFACVDSFGGRHIADRLAAAIIQPLFDVGVSIPVYRPDGEIAISNVSGRVDYIQPKRSSLSDRGVYTPQRLAAEEKRERDPEAYKDLVGEGYMPGANEEAPSVIPLNMRAASAVVQEFIARRYPYRLEPNSRYARTKFDLAAEEHEYFTEESFKATPQAYAGRGLEFPLLGLPALEDMRCR
ncbi:ThiF family adenylyltransferase [Xanthomonas campestris]|uniref:ThiF family adenylyltransferase n=2 Tax=Xanthomonas campestris TaxID=339 RepID=UPI002B2235F8|nr:ThiF family adenylyltransferase [Xanthomonas campestris]MEA9762493.1 ThiF family adenylyltransferase [Xanthomonas campestris pv. raphani]MEA9908053.1 ThiF family adenylyltransferase [Xanthomonas campestris pv. raphani]MEA9924140.1 ThiF family adenylyltransferase [Xanthomonas campestris pv. raphani]MEA9944286.1 ThiF family adenylyltransferase [Xanthomonas campestris pv. raphani]